MIVELREEMSWGYQFGRDKLIFVVKILKPGKITKIKRRCS